MRNARHEGDFAHSLTDLMSGVAVMFLVIAAIFMVQATQAKKRAQILAEEAKIAAAKNKVDAEKYKVIDQREQRGIQEIETLRTELASNRNIELVYDKDKDPRLLTIVFNRDSLQFLPGACEVSGGTRDVLRQTLQSIFPQVCASVGQGLQKIITLEGHTDNKPPYSGSCKGIEWARHCFGSRTDERCTKESFEGNVQLSAARAQHVFFQARDALKLDPVVAQCLDRNFMVAGRGPMDPLDGDRWDKGRTDAENDKNRRVVIKVRVMVASDRGVQ